MIFLIHTVCLSHNITIHDICRFSSMTSLIQLKKKFKLLCLWCDLTMLSNKMWKLMPSLVKIPVQTQMTTQIWDPIC